MYQIRYKKEDNNRIKIDKMVNILTKNLQFEQYINQNIPIQQKINTIY